MRCENARHEQAPCAIIERFSDCPAPGKRICITPVDPHQGTQHLTTTAMKTRDARKESKKAPTKTAKEKKLAKLEKKKNK